eukprot:63519-Amphidinium_carterae.1
MLSMPRAIRSLRPRVANPLAMPLFRPRSSLQQQSESSSTLFDNQLCGLHLMDVGDVWGLFQFERSLRLVWTHRVQYVPSKTFFPVSADP